MSLVFHWKKTTQPRYLSSISDLKMCDTLQSIKEQLDNIEGDCFSVHTEFDVYSSAEPSLESMPLEIILKIFSYLDADFLKTVLDKVCRRFADILADISVWKHRASCQMNGCYPPLAMIEKDYHDEMDWIKTCVEIDVERNKWRNVDNTTKHYVIRDVHYASVDAVILVNQGKTCISGGRDRCLALWNVADIKYEDNNEKEFVLTNLKPKKIRHSAHAGWVWDLATDSLDSNSYVYSASWDNTVKVWDIEYGFECIETFQCGMSALSVVSFGHTAMAGLYSKKILSFDLRNGSSPVNVYKPHKGPVLALTAYKDYVASVSEDKSLAIFDRVAGKIMKSDIKIPSDKAYPICVSWSNHAMYVGDSKGTLHLFSLRENKYIRSYELWRETTVTEPSNKIVDCHQGQSTLICCSDRGEIKFLYNSNPPTEFHSIRTNTVEITQLRYVNGILAVGTCDAALEFWIPNDTLDNTYL